MASTAPVPLLEAAFARDPAPEDHQRNKPSRFHQDRAERVRDFRVLINMTRRYD